MDSITAALIALGLVGLILGLFYVVISVVKGQTDGAGKMDSIVSSQRQATQSRVSPDGKRSGFTEAAEEAKVEKLRSSRVTLEKLLKYANWKIPPLAFRLVQLSTGLILMGISFWFKANPVLMSMLTWLGWIVPSWVLMHFVNKRFMAFEADYAPFLMSLVGLIKTGMNPMTALQASADGLEPGSLVKSEVELLLERLRLGVAEDLSIGAFGEDVAHPEIELFVQALLLSRKVGGNLSDTLERLAKQVRKRQQFRQSAYSSVSAQRFAIMFIIGIVLALGAYIAYMAPDLVSRLVTTSIGWQLLQTSVCSIIIGIVWIRQITKIRI